MAVSVSLIDTIGGACRRLRRAANITCSPQPGCDEKSNGALDFAHAGWLVFPSMHFVNSMSRIGRRMAIRAAGVFATLAVVAVGCQSSKQHEVRGIALLSHAPGDRPEAQATDGSRRGSG